MISRYLVGQHAGYPNVRKQIEQTIRLVNSARIRSPRRQQVAGCLRRTIQKYAAAHHEQEVNLDVPATATRSSWWQLFTASPLRAVAVAAQ